MILAWRGGVWLRVMGLWKVMRLDEGVGSGLKWEYDTGYIQIANVIPMAYYYEYSLFFGMKCLVPHSHLRNKKRNYNAIAPLFILSKEPSQIC